MVIMTSLAFGVMEQPAHAQMTSHNTHSQTNTRGSTTPSSGTAPSNTANSAYCILVHPPNFSKLNSVIIRHI